MFTLLTSPLVHRALLHCLALGCALILTRDQSVVELQPGLRLQRFVLDSATSRIGFEADATLGGFRGNARKILGWVETSQPDFSDARGEIDVAASSFQTGLGMRDRHLRETLESQTHPVVRFVLDSARLARLDSAGADWYRLHGRLTVRNVTREQDLLARISLQGDSIVAAGNLAARFTDFEMKPPSRLLGTTKVKNEFTITFHCTFIAQSAGLQANQQRTAAVRRER
jgi:polyisoprenoid-binding protein YceI